MNKFFKRGALLFPVVFWGYDYYLTDEKLMTRNLRALKVGIQILYNYKIKFSAENENVNEIHEKIAKSLYEMCKNNDGLYVKFGQGVASMEHILPPSYFKYFQMLQDQAKKSSFEKVKNIIETDLGQNISDMFSYFEEEPIASASIAQVYTFIDYKQSNIDKVHRARLKTDDTLVAVKIQKPNIKKQFYSDMFMHWLFCYVMEKSFDLPILVFAKKIEEELEKEIDFSLEARNAEICRQNFQKTKRNDIYMRKLFNFSIITFQTHNRQLFIFYIQLHIYRRYILTTQAKELQQWNLLKTIEAFAEQIFVTHFVHADPHPGNIFVRRNPKNKNQAQIVILDFGLCYPLSEQFGQQYCKFWKSIFLNQQNELMDVVREWGIGNSDMFVSSQLMKPYKAGRPVSKNFSKDEIYELQMKFKTDFRKMLEDSNKFPNELLFVNRNMNLIRSINKRMGSIVNRINVMAKYASIGINDTYFEKNWNVFKFVVRLWFSDFVYWAAQKWLKFKNRKSVEEVLEDSMKQQIEGQYKKYGWKPVDHKTYDS